jgi:hypothetical protein
MGRPSKPLAVSSWHMTKAEIEARKKAEQDLLSQTKMKEWPEVRGNEYAHRLFTRTRFVLSKIGKDDALHEAVLNRYALIGAEVKEFEEGITAAKERLDELKALRESGQMEVLDYIKMSESVQSRLLTIDKRIMDKRKMMLDIERENVMTIASALRSIPKKPEKKSESSMAEFLKKRQTGEQAKP